MTENFSTTLADEVRAATTSQLRRGLAASGHNVYIRVNTNGVGIGGVYRKNDATVEGHPAVVDINHALVSNICRRRRVMSTVVTSIIEGVQAVKQAAQPLVIYMTNDMIDGLDDPAAMRSFWKTYGTRNGGDDGDGRGFYETVMVTGYKIRS